MIARFQASLLRDAWVAERPPKVAVGFNPRDRVFHADSRRGATLDSLRTITGWDGLRGVIAGSVVVITGTMIAGLQASLRNAVRSFAGSVG